MIYFWYLFLWVNIYYFEYDSWQRLSINQSFLLLFIVYQYHFSILQVLHQIKPPSWASIHHHEIFFDESSILPDNYVLYFSFEIFILFYNFQNFPQWLIVFTFSFNWFSFNNLLADNELGHILFFLRNFNSLLIPHVK